MRYSRPEVRSSIAHLWFVSIHPFDDGYGRITRAITDMLLARSEHSAKRFYSMSNEMKILQKEYYDVLEKTQIGKCSSDTALNDIKDLVEKG